MIQLGNWNSPRSTAAIPTTQAPFVVGQVLDLAERIQTFSGSVPTRVVISAVYADHFGRWMCNLANHRDQMVASLVDCESLRDAAEVETEHAVWESIPEPREMIRPIRETIVGSRILFRSIEEPIVEPTKEQHYESTLEDNLIATWNIARKNAERYRARGELHLLENGFKKETATYIASQQGHEGRDLEINLDKFDHRGWLPGTFPLSESRFDKYRDSQGIQHDDSQKPVLLSPVGLQLRPGCDAPEGNRSEAKAGRGRTEDEGRGVRTIESGENYDLSDRGPEGLEQRTDRGESAIVSRPVAAVGGALLAVDLMNILVRCFYVGTPSDVNGIRGMLSVIAKTIKALQPAQIVFAGDGGHAHRDKLHPGYKAHRPERPELLQKQVDIVDQVIESIGWAVIRKPGFEADDVLASIVSHHSNVIVISTDKDLLQLIARGARVYQPFGDAAGFVDRDAVVAKMGVEPHQIADLLSLAGDKTDGIPGVPGIGPVKAAALLQEFEDLDTILAQAMLNTSIKGKIRELLREHRNAAQMSRELATLVHDLHVVHNLASLRGVRELRSTWRESLQRFKLPAAIRDIEAAMASSTDSPSVPKARQKPLFV